jgi:hypothetical protein
MLAQHHGRAGLILIPALAWLMSERRAALVARGVAPPGSH